MSYYSIYNMWKYSLVCKVKSLSDCECDLFCQIFTDKHEARVLFIVSSLLCYETEKPLLALVICTVGDAMQGVLVQDAFGLGLLNRNTIHADGQLYFRDLGPLRLAQLLVEFQFPNAFFHHFYSFRLVDVSVTQKLKEKSY